jgi:hypothetical protein
MPDYRYGEDSGNAASVVMLQGFTMPPIPEDQPSLPRDITELDSPALMEMFSLFTAWCDYASAQVGLAVIDERSAERSLELREAEAWRDLPKSSVSAAKALVALDEGVQRAREHRDGCYAYRRLVSDLAVRYERDAALLSRELTRRTGESSPRSARRERWERS